MCKRTFFCGSIFACGPHLTPSPPTAGLPLPGGEVLLILRKSSQRKALARFSLIHFPPHNNKLSPPSRGSPAAGGEGVRADQETNNLQDCKWGYQLLLRPTSYFLLPTSYFLLPASSFLLPASSLLLPASSFLLLLLLPPFLIFQHGNKTEFAECFCVQFCV